MTFLVPRGAAPREREPKEGGMRSRVPVVVGAVVVVAVALLPAVAAGFEKVRADRDGRQAKRDGIGEVLLVDACRE